MDLDKKYAFNEKPKSVKNDEAGMEVEENEKRLDIEGFFEFDINKNTEFIELIENRSNNINTSNKENKLSKIYIFLNSIYKWILIYQIFLILILGEEFNSNDENSEIIGDKEKTNPSLKKIMKKNSNSISCNNSKTKPDINIDIKINIPAKNNRLTNKINKNADKEIAKENRTVKTDKYNLDKYKELDSRSHKITDSIRKTKNYLNEEATKKVNLTKLEEIEDKIEFEDNVEELCRKGKSYDSGVDSDGIWLIKIKQK